MPLPEPNTAWPPPQMVKPLAAMAVDDAWYSGDRDRIRKAYQKPGAETTSTGRRLRFWERPRNLAAPDHSLHVPLPGDIATTSADLLFSEPPKLMAETPSTQERLEELAEAGGLANTLLEAAEVCAALRGAYMRVTWDEELAQRALLTVHHADTAIPTWRSGILAAVTFWRELENDGTRVLRHLELHEVGAIRHALYEGTTASIGRVVPLTEHEETTPLAASLDKGGDGQTISTGIQRLTARYVRNMGPDRQDRRSQLGRSDYQGLHGMFHALDEVWSSWIRDIRLAKSRLIIPNGYLQTTGPGLGAWFDVDQEVLAAINTPPTAGEGITENQFAIRVDEHQRTADAIVREAVKLAGYSPQSFGLDEGGATVTATEVVASRSKSLTTRGKKSRYWAPELADMLEVQLMMDVQLGFSKVTPERPTVDFGRGSEDSHRVAETLSLLAQAQAISTEAKVRMRSPDLDDTAVREETARILKETGQGEMADPTQTGAE